MKQPPLWLLAICVVLIVGLVILVGLTTPKAWPFSPSSVSARLVQVDGRSFVVFDGDGVNYLSQLQIMNVDYNSANKQVTLSRCCIRWNPFVRFRVNQQLPIFYPLESACGVYAAVVDTTAGREIVASLDADSLVLPPGKPGVHGILTNEVTD